MTARERQMLELVAEAEKWSTARERQLGAMVRGNDLHEAIREVTNSAATAAGGFRTFSEQLREYAKVSGIPIVESDLVPADTVYAVTDPATGRQRLVTRDASGMFVDGQEVEIRSIDMT